MENCHFMVVGLRVTRFFFILMSNVAAGTIIYRYGGALLRPGTLLSRYKRFLADVKFDGGEPQETVYMPNTGSMLMLVAPHNDRPRCYCSEAPADTKRKYRYTVEILQAQAAWVGIHSALANNMAEAALRAGLIDGCSGFTELRREVPVTLGRDGLSKIDFELSWGDRKMLLEVPSPQGVPPTRFPPLTLAPLREQRSSR